MVPAFLNEYDPLHVGFTGTQVGMNERQLGMFTRRMENAPYGCGRERLNRTIYFHHGCCIGSDKQAHDVAISLGFRVILHPPTNRSKMADCDGAWKVRDPLPYMVRNSAIVRECHVLFATPKEDEEVVRSGTWATVRRAKKADKPVDMICPTVDKMWVPRRGLTRIIEFAGF